MRWNRALEVDVAVSAYMAKAAARGGGKARVGPEESAARKRRRAGSATDDEAPVAGPGVCELVGGGLARLDWAGASKARASGGRGGLVE